MNNQSNVEKILRDLYQRCDVSNNQIVDTVGENEFIKTVEALIASEGDNSYLRHFSYVDWETGDDDKLRAGDYIHCNHQRAFDGYETDIYGQIVKHHSNGLPMVMCNVDPKDPDNSGDYEDLQTLWMYGWEFSRIRELPHTGEE